MLFVTHSAQWLATVNPQYLLTTAHDNTIAKSYEVEKAPIRMVIVISQTTASCQGRANVFYIGDSRKRGCLSPLPLYSLLFSKLLCRSEFHQRFWEEGFVTTWPTPISPSCACTMHTSVLKALTSPATKKPLRFCSWFYPDNFLLSGSWWLTLLNIFGLVGEWSGFFKKQPDFQTLSHSPQRAVPEEEVGQPGAEPPHPSPRMTSTHWIRIAHRWPGCLWVLCVGSLI